jgi:hypothetical protein
MAKYSDTRNHPHGALECQISFNYLPEVPVYHSWWISMSKHMFSGTISEKGISRLEQMKSAKERLPTQWKIFWKCATIQMFATK